MGYIVEFKNNGLGRWTRSGNVAKTVSGTLRLSEYVFSNREDAQHEAEAQQKGQGTEYRVTAVSEPPTLPTSNWIVEYQFNGGSWKRSIEYDGVYTKAEADVSLIPSVRRCVGDVTTVRLGVIRE